MAGDWIKMRTGLYREPKVCLIADLLMDKDSELSRYVNQHCRCDMAVTRNVTRNAVVGALVTVWGVVRHTARRSGDDAVIRGASLAVVDDIAELPGFGAAMAEVGWLRETADGVVFPRFFAEFNADPATEAKSKGAERQRRYRQKQAVTSGVTGDVTGPSQSDAREEKSREEKKEEDADASSCSEPPKPAASEPALMTLPCVGKGPKEWPLTEAKLAEYAETFPGVDVLAEVRKARQWLIDNTARRKTFGGIPRFLGSWLGKQQNESRQPARPPPRSMFDHNERVMDELADIAEGAYE